MKTLPLRRSHLASTTFCWLPPESRPHGRARRQACEIDSRSIILRRAALASRPRSETAAPPANSPATPASRSADVEVEHHALGGAGPPGAGRSRRAAPSTASWMPTCAPATRHLPGGRRDRRRRSADQLGPPGARRARRCPSTSPARRSKLTSSTRRRLESVDAQQLLALRAAADAAGCAGARRAVCPSAVPVIAAIELSSGRSARSDRWCTTLAVAHTTTRCR